jgi:L-2-hydroxyglutarate oxidase LhgO
LRVSKEFLVTCFSSLLAGQLQTSNLKPQTSNFKLNLGDQVEDLDVVVIGAGIVGLAVARELSLAGREVIILEADTGIGMEASSRTGEVVHAGIHYAPGSRRSSLCTAGKELLYTYCHSREVAHQKLGELIIITEPSAAGAVEKIKDQARASGVDDVLVLDKRQVKVLEPDLKCEAALLSPSTGIVDSHGLMNALLRDAEEEGAILLLGTPCLDGRVNGGGIEIELGGPEPTRATCRSLINSAGIHAQSVAGSMEGLNPGFVPSSYLCKGSYFTSSVRTPFSHLIYSTPSHEGPGIHLSFDLAGQSRFGPDAVWMDTIDYDIDSGRAVLFEQGVRRYWPDIPENALQPGFAGYFARTFGPDDPQEDWIIQGPEDHGIPGLVNLFGIDSPGLTACMAIAECVRDMLGIEKK